MDGGWLFALRPVLRRDPLLSREDALRGFFVVDAAKLDEEADAAVDEHAFEGITAADVVARLHVSRSLADLRFREVTGTSILEAILARRLDEVKRLLRETNLRISEIAARCGYRDANYLKNLFKKRTGMSMREWRAQSSPQEVIKKQLQRITGG